MHTLTIPEWHDPARDGAAPPMRIRIDGNSMFPLVRIHRDHVTIRPVEEAPVPGDIVLFADPDRPRYVLHRVWAVEEDRVLTWGDNCPRPDGWIPREAIWGQAVLIERGRRVPAQEHPSRLRRRATA